jgi:hypothetical protein
MTTPALAARGAHGTNLGRHVGCRTSRDGRDARVERIEQPAAFTLAQSPDARGVFLDGLAHHGALGLAQPLGRPPQPRNGLVVERERHLDHIDAILPYSQHGAFVDVSRRATPLGLAGRANGPPPMAQRGERLHPRGAPSGNECRGNTDERGHRGDGQQRKRIVAP